MGNSSSTHQPLERGFTRGTFGDIKNVKSSSFRSSKRSPKKMDRLRKSFRDSFRRRKDRVPEASKPHMWQADETDVRNATCVFPVKYLGCVEVFESRGMQVCEEAVKVLRSSKRRPVRGQLHVSGDGLRVVDEDTKALLVDQTIEKVSFCAPDRSHERGFSYICRDGTTRRWMCHGFLASKDSGERLSHAVGCAFAVCLERKQRRDKECTVTGTFDTKTSTFTRTGSFRQTTMTERLVDPPSAIVLPQPKAYNPFAIERPHATPSMLERQGSFRGFTQMDTKSPFKRQTSLRITDLQSNAERQKAYLDTNTPQRMAVSPIPEVSPNQLDTVSELCKELSQGIALLTTKDTEDFLNLEKLANGIISGNSPIILDSSAISTHSSFASATNSSAVSTRSSYINKPAPPKTVTSPITSVTPYRPLMSIAHTGPLANFVPLRKAMPILHKQLIDDDSPEIPVRSIVSTTNATSTISSIAEKIPRTPSPTLGFTLAAVPPDALPSSPQKVVQIETVNPLPKADQWLTDIVKNTSPAPRRAPAFNVQSRSKSLAPVDPFDTTVAEWATGADRPEIHSTNPFITPTKPPVQQSFQVQL